MNSLLPLSTLGSTIRAHIEAADKASAKAEEHHKAAGIHLIEAKQRVRQTNGVTWPGFLAKYCHIKRSRADELIQIADGRATNEELNRRKSANNKLRLSKSAAARGGSSRISQQNQSSDNSETLICPRCGQRLSV